jgi:hypothetical protein
MAEAVKIGMGDVLMYGRKVVLKGDHRLGASQTKYLHREQGTLQDIWQE